MKKKRIIITISLYVVVLTALYLTVCAWASIFDENWVMGKTEEQINGMGELINIMMIVLNIGKNKDWAIKSIEFI